MPPPSSPRPALAQFLGGVFASPDQLTAWAYLHLNALKDALPPRATLDELAIRVVEHAGNAGFIDAEFFENLRQTFPRHTSAISDLAVLWESSAPTTDTARIIDRISQWSSLLDACGEQDKHLFFLVHGNREGSVQQFMQRIARYLDLDCARRHDVAHVSTGYDQQVVSTVQSWERAFIEKTHLAGGTLDVALADFAEQRAVLFLLDHRKGPLPLARFAARPQPGRREPLKELGGFLSSNLRHALVDGGLANPLRIVIPIEYEDSSDLVPLEPLRRALDAVAPLVVARELVLAFPDWQDVEPSLRTKMRGVDPATLGACKQAYDLVAARPDRSVRLLGNELHNLILDWKDANRRA